MLFKKDSENVDQICLAWDKIQQYKYFGSIKRQRVFWLAPQITDSQDLSVMELVNDSNSNYSSVGTGNALQAGQLMNLG